MFCTCLVMQRIGFYVLKFNEVGMHFCIYYILTVSWLKIQYFAMHVRDTMSIIDSMVYYFIEIHNARYCLCNDV